MNSRLPHIRHFKNLVDLAGRAAAVPDPTIARSRFLVFEGIDGSGKSTQARMLAETLREHFKEPVVLTAEPSTGPIGVRLRLEGANLSPLEQTRLFAEDRRQHLKTTIEPALRQGQTVICDRYVYSNLAYQGARGVPLQAILDANTPFALEPYLVFLMELDVDEALARILANRRERLSGFEERHYLIAVDAVYRSLEASCMVRVDGSGPTEDVHRRILTILREGGWYEDRPGPG